MPATAASSSHYNLELLPQKENVFVTQLNERTENEDIRRFPIVKESADKLLQSGINTLQSTSLLRQAVEVEHVNRELEEKREEFRKRMEVCKAKKEALKLRKQQMKDRVGKFDKFLKDNEAKRIRALRKYQREVKENEVKGEELHRMNEELENLKKHREALLLRLAKNKIYERYLTSVADIFPEDYLEMSGDSVLQGVIQRHEGLSATNMSLLERNQEILSSLEIGQKEFDDIRRERSKQKLVFNSELVALQSKMEKLVLKNKTLEQKAASAQQKKRNLLGKLGQLLMGIDNLALQSHRRHWPSLTDMTYVQKLTMVQEHILERVAVEKYVLRLMAEADGLAVFRNAGLESKTGSGSLAKQSPLPKHPVLPPISNTGPYKKSLYDPGTDSNKKQLNKSGAGQFLERLAAITEV